VNMYHHGRELADSLMHFHGAAHSALAALPGAGVLGAAALSAAAVAVIRRLRRQRA
jgi:transposase